MASATAMWATSSARSASGTANALTASVAVPMAALWLSAPDMSPAAKPGSSCRNLDEDRSREAGEAHDDGQQHRLEALALERLHELRTDRVADAEQKEQKEEGFGHARDGHMGELPDEQAGKERARDRAETERPDLEAADPVAGGDHQKQCELRVADQELLQPSQHRDLPPPVRAPLRPARRHSMSGSE